MKISHHLQHHCPVTMMMDMMIRISHLRHHRLLLHHHQEHPPQRQVQHQNHHLVLLIFNHYLDVDEEQQELLMDIHLIQKHRGRLLDVVVVLKEILLSPAAITTIQTITITTTTIIVSTHAVDQEVPEIIHLQQLVVEDNEVVVVALVNHPNHP